MNDDPLWSPGLKRRGRAVYWCAAQITRNTRGFLPRSVRLDGFSPEQRARHCQKLHAELLDWLGAKPQRIEDRYDGTVASLIAVYAGHPQSPYARVRSSTKDVYDGDLRLIRKAIGARRIDGVTAVDLRRWYENFRKPSEEGGPERVRRAHGAMQMIRSTMTWGAALELKGCRRLKEILKSMRFEGSSPRRQILTLDQVKRIIAKAHELGRPSVALAQSLQFECALRQSDVVGYWDLIEGERPESGILAGRRIWRYGLLWNHVRDLVMEKTTSKTGAVAIVNLALSPMVMAEIARVPAERRVGPMIIDEMTSRPYANKEFGRAWRIVARAAGVPDTIWNRDSRAGAVTEASHVAPLEMVRHLAQHSDVQTTARYSRGTLEKTSKVLSLRQAARAENKG